MTEEIKGTIAFDDGMIALMTLVLTWAPPELPAVQQDRLRREVTEVLARAGADIKRVVMATMK